MEDDVIYAQRSKANPAQELFDNRPRKSTKRKAEYNIENDRKPPPNPGAQKEALRTIAKEFIQRMHDRKTNRSVRFAKQEAIETIAQSRASNPIRMDEFDRKRQSYDDILSDLDRRIGMTVSSNATSIELPPKRRMVV